MVDSDLHCITLNWKNSVCIEQATACSSESWKERRGHKWRGHGNTRFSNVLMVIPNFDRAYFQFTEYIPTRMHSTWGIFMCVWDFMRITLEKRARNDRATTTAIVEDVWCIVSSCPILIAGLSFFECILWSLDWRRKPSGGKRNDT